MSSKNRFFTGIALAFAVGAFATFASAQESATTAPPEGVTKQDKFDRKGYGKRGGKRGGKDGLMRGLRGIELTDAQKEQIRAIREANRPDESVREEMKTLREAKRVGTLTADQQERLEVIKQQGRAKAELVQQQVLAILTSEQRQQLEQKQQEMRERREQRRQMRDQNKPQTENPADN